MSTANTMAVIATPRESEDAPKRPRMPPISSRVHESASSEMHVAIAPPIMNGRRLPNRERQRSDLIPM